MGEGMKTPEEIKKGLGCCARLKFPNAYCDNCPYLVKAAENLWECKTPEILTDAIAYIQQLEQINADFAERMARLETQVGKDTNVPRWISVEERLPDKQGDHLVLYSFGETDAQCFAGVMYFMRYDERPHFENDGLYGLHVTHWMPLPELPKEGKQ